MKVFLAGEGKTELGDWFHAPAYRSGKDKPGLLEALLSKLGFEVEVIDGIHWKAIPKYDPRDRLGPEAKTVLGAALTADEAGADVLVFVRDRDGDAEREIDLERGLKEAPQRVPAILIAGAAAAQQIEAWLLALLQERGSESHADAKGVLKARPHEKESRADKVAVVEAANFGRRANDCPSFERWIERVTKALS